VAPYFTFHDLHLSNGIRCLLIKSWVIRSY